METTFWSFEAGDVGHVNLREVHLILPALAKQKSLLLAELRQGDVTSVQGKLATGETVSVMKLRSVVKEVRSDGHVGIQLPSDVEVDIAMPQQLFQDLVQQDDIALSVTAFHGKMANNIAAAAEIEFHSILTGETVPVQNLQDPIIFTLPVIFSRSPSVKCAFWDEGEAAWSTRGVKVNSQSILGGQLFCETYHLSLFGSVTGGVVQTVTCANFDIFTMEAAENVFKGKWYMSQGALCCWYVLSGLFVIFVAASALDYSRQKSFHWTDANFLLPALPEPVAPDADGTSGDEEEPSVGCRLACVAMLASAWAWLMGSSILRDVLDDIGSSWFEYFGEVRSACEDTCVWPDGTLTSKVTGHMIINVSERMTAASLGMSHDVVSFVLGSQELANYIMEDVYFCQDEPEDLEAGGRVRRHSFQSSLSSLSSALQEPDAGFGRRNSISVSSVSSRSSLASEDWRTTENQRAAWVSLRREVCERLWETAKTQGTRPCLLKTIATLFFVENPIGALFSFDIFKSCKQRVLVLMVEVLGSFALSCAFFEASGLVRGKSNANDMCDDDAGEPSVGATIGRLIVIAYGSLICAGIPVVFLESLQTKDFKRVEGGHGSAAWKRQLRVWQVQDRIFWTISVLYILFCLAYTIMFLANIGEGDHADWTFAGLLGMGQDFLLLPFLIAFFVPFAAHIISGAQSSVGRVAREELARRACVMLHTRNNNFMLPIESI